MGLTENTLLSDSIYSPAFISAVNNTTAGHPLLMALFKTESNFNPFALRYEKNWNHFNGFNKAKVTLRDRGFRVKDDLMRNMFKTSLVCHK